MIREAWRKWLTDHETRGVYDEHPKRVTDLCKEGSAVEKFETLSKSKNIALLTKASMGARLQTTFYHSVVGVPIKPEDQSYVAMTGKFGRGVEMDPSSIFKSTKAVHVPTLVDLMKVSTVGDFEALSPPGRGQKKKINSYATLVPHLTEAIHRTDMSTGEVYVSIVEGVKATMGLSRVEVPSLMPEGEGGEGGDGEEETGGAPEDSVEEMLKKVGGPYENVLRFVWASHHHPGEVSAPTTSSLQEEATVQWEIEALEGLIPKSPVRETVDLTGQREVAAEPSGALTALAKLSECMTKHQEAVTRAQDEKKDSRLKAWNKLPNIQKNVILLGGVDDQGMVPEKPTDELLSILGCSNGAQVEQYVKQLLTDFNVHVEPGLCSAINKGIFVHADDGTMPRHFTGFLTPPISDEEDKVQNSDLLRVAVQTKFSDRDVTVLTKMDVSVPMNTRDLEHHVKNWSGLAGLCFGEGCLLHQALVEVSEHIRKREVAYNYEFRQERLFGGSFLDRLHWRTHRFLESCAGGDPGKVDLTKLNFSHIMEDVACREFSLKVPSWIQKVMKKLERRTPPGGEGNGRRPTQGDGGRAKKISNPDQHDCCRLKEGEQFRFLFHPGNLDGLEKPQRKDGEALCMKFHTMGFCFTDCKYRSGHGRLSEDEKVMMSKFLTGVRNKRKAFVDGRKGGQRRTGGEKPWAGKQG